MSESWLRLLAFLLIGAMVALTVLIYVQSTLTEQVVTSTSEPDAPTIQRAFVPKQYVESVGTELTPTNFQQPNLTPITGPILFAPFYLSETTFRGDLFLIHDYTFGSASSEIFSGLVVSVLNENSWNVVWRQEIFDANEDMKVERTVALGYHEIARLLIWSGDAGGKEGEVLGAQQGFASLCTISLSPLALRSGVHRWNRLPVGASLDGFGRLVALGTSPLDTDPLSVIAVFEEHGDSLSSSTLTCYHIARDHSVSSLGVISALAALSHIEVDGDFLATAPTGNGKWVLYRRKFQFVHTWLPVPFVSQLQDSIATLKYLKCYQNYLLLIFTTPFLKISLYDMSGENEKLVFTEDFVDLKFIGSVFVDRRLLAISLQQGTSLHVLPVHQGSEGWTLGKIQELTKVFSSQPTVVSHLSHVIMNDYMHVTLRGGNQTFLYRIEVTLTS